MPYCQTQQTIIQDKTQEMTLKEETIKGVKWSGLSRGSQQTLQLAISVILARLLMPEDFGVLAMAVVFTGLIAIFNDFGIGAATIQMQDLSDDDLSSIFWFNLFIGLIATLFTVVISPLIAAFYDKDILIPILSILGLGFLLSSFSVIQRSILIKKMDFKKIAMVEIITTVISGTAAIYLAYMGYGVWSLVWQGIIAAVITGLIYWIISQWKPKFKFQFGTVKSIMKFSINMLGFNIVNYFSRNADYLLIGKFLGAESLGYYTLAYKLMLYPLQNISSIISRVLFPAFSAIQGDDVRLRSAYLKATKLIAFVTFPVMFGLFALADELILTVYSAKWEPAIILFKIFCFVGMIQSIGSTVGQIYLAKGKTDWMFRWGLFASILIVCAIALGLYWGVKGVAISYAVGAFILAYPNFAIPFRLINLKVKTLVLNLKTEFYTSLMMFVIVFSSVVIQRQIGIESKVILISNILLGIAIYLVATKILNSDAYNEIQGMVWSKKKI